MTADPMKEPFPGVHRIGPLYWMTGDGTGWFRLFRRGLHWTRRDPLFSERHGYKKPLLKIGPWRVRYLPKGGSTQR